MSNTTKEIKRHNAPQATARTIAAEARAFVKRAVPDGINAEHVLLALQVALRDSPKLVQCDRGSLFKAIYQIAALGLTPNDARGLAYLLPYGSTCQLIIGYRGMIQLVVGGGGAESIRAGVVADGDHFEWAEGLEPVLVHRPRSSAPAAAKVTHSYAIATLPGGGGKAWVVLTRDDIDARRPTNKRPSPWDTHFAEMAKKSAVRALCKYLVMSPDRAMKMARAEAAEAGELDEAGEQALADAGIVDAEVTEREPGEDG